MILAVLGGVGSGTYPLLDRNRVEREKGEELSREVRKTKGQKKRADAATRQAKANEAEARENARSSTERLGKLYWESAIRAWELGEGGRVSIYLCESYRASPSGRSAAAAALSVSELCELEEIWRHPDWAGTVAFRITRAHVERDVSPRVTGS